MERSEKKGRARSLILDIPLQILCDILLKLPVWSIRQCGCVCKTFRDIVSDSEFKQLYSSQVCFLLYNSKRLWCIDSCALTATPTLKQSHQESTNANGLPFIDKSRFITFQMPASMKLVNSSNGLVCLRSIAYLHPRYYICNPLLGEILRVPPAPTAVCRYSAFGFDPKSKQCKILQLFDKSETDTVVVAELYQSGDDKWRVIEDAPTPSVGYCCAFDPSLNGALHWLPWAFSMSNFIHSFDLHTNEFKLLPPPPHLSEFKISSPSVGVLKGCLCLCYVTEDGQFETWLMEKYGVQESWSKVFTIDVNSSYHGGPRLLNKYGLFGFSSSGDMWVKAASFSCSLVSYSAEAGVFRQIDIGGGSSPIFQATPHVLSFVSLKDMGSLRDTHLQIEKLPVTHLDSTICVHYQT